jgi:hypothetical protein
MSNIIQKGEKQMKINILNEVRVCFLLSYWPDMVLTPSSASTITLLQDSPATGYHEVTEHRTEELNFCTYASK